MRSREPWVHALSLVLAVVLALGMAVALAGCSGGDTEPEEPATNGEQEPADGDENGEDGEEPEPAQEMTVKLYFSYAGESAMGIERTVPYSEAVATAALEALLEGPTDAEVTTWPALGTQIPPDTELLGVDIVDGVAKVDLSGEFASGGGTFSMTARLAQVVYTVCEFDTVDSVEFYLDGEKVDVFSGEGIILDAPQTPEDYFDLLPIEA